MISTEKYLSAQIEDVVPILRLEFEAKYHTDLIPSE